MRATFGKVCEAMAKEGITNSESQEGINFCVDRCPYDCCVIAEPIVSKKGVVKLSIVKRAKELKERWGYDAERISRILGVSKRTVRRYLGDE